MKKSTKYVYWKKHEKVFIFGPNWTLILIKNPQNTSPDPVWKTTSKKDAQHYQARPLETMKSSVSCTRNHSLWISTFARKCLRWWPQSLPFAQIIAVEVAKNASQTCVKRTYTKYCFRGTKIHEKHTTFFWFVRPLFAFFVDQDPTR